ncbi:MAG TPA: RNase adapter RapZ [Thermoanaerobaculaceae bacterium]|nr:RNase adapter RapZ [Thermoanaerobaculaceae bacterium]
MEAVPRAVVVTGLSGAGKSVVTRCFEDLGFRCVDNLPLELIEPLFAQIWSTPGPPWAVVLDVRAQGFAGSFPELIARLNTAHPEVRLVFVEAATDAIVRRFSETRRPHPYRNLALEAAVIRERSELEPVRNLADETLDTTGLTPHELRAEVAARFGSTELALPMVVRCESFGFRYGLPPDANLVFDLRFLPNPHFVAELRPLPGDHPDVQGWLERQAEVEETYARIREFVTALLPAYRREQKSYLVVAFGCTGGRHRSVYFADRLARDLSAGRWVVALQHRDRDREG